MLTFPAPAAVNGKVLADDLAAAGLPSRVALAGATLELLDLTAADRAKVQPLIDGHAVKAKAAADAEATAATNAHTIRQAAANALAANRDDIGTNDTYLAITGSPTNAQNLAQIRALSAQSTRQARELNALIRLVLGRLDGTD